jgi:hypothetical protein
VRDTSRGLRLHYNADTNELICKRGSTIEIYLRTNFRRARSIIGRLLHGLCTSGAIATGLTAIATGLAAAATILSISA